MVDGGIRLRLASIAGPSLGIDYEHEAPALLWPEDELYAAAEKDGPAFFSISADTERALTRGHPWVLPDEYSDDPDAFAAGTMVRLGQKPSGICAVGHIQGRGRVAARVWQRGWLGATSFVAGRRSQRGRNLLPPPPLSEGAPAVLALRMCVIQNANMESVFVILDGVSYRRRTCSKEFEWRSSNPKASSKPIHM